MCSRSTECTDTWFSIRLPSLYLEGGLTRCWLLLPCQVEQRVSTQDVLHADPLLFSLLLPLLQSMHECVQRQILHLNHITNPFTNLTNITNPFFHSDLQKKRVRPGHSNHIPPYCSNTFFCSLNLFVLPSISICQLDANKVSQGKRAFGKYTD